MVCNGLLWYVVVCGGVYWCVMMYGGVWGCVVVFAVMMTSWLFFDIFF